MVSRNIIQLLSDDLKSRLLPAKYTTDMLQLLSVADKQHMDASLSDKITQKILKLHTLSVVPFFTTVMSFSHLNQGELTSLPPLLFPFFNNGTSAGRLWRDCNTEVILVCWSCSSLGERNQHRNI